VEFVFWLFFTSRVSFFKSFGLLFLKQKTGLIGDETLWPFIIIIAIACVVNVRGFFFLLSTQEIFL